MYNLRSRRSWTRIDFVYPDILQDTQEYLQNTGWSELLFSVAVRETSRQSARVSKRWTRSSFRIRQANFSVNNKSKLVNAVG